MIRKTCLTFVERKPLLSSEQNIDWDLKLDHPVKDVLNHQLKEFRIVQLQEFVAYIGHVDQQYQTDDSHTKSHRNSYKHNDERN